MRKLKTRLHDLNQRIRALEQRVTKLIEETKSKKANPKTKENRFDVTFSWELIRLIICVARVVIDLIMEL